MCFLALSTVLAVTPTFHFPAAEADPGVSVDLSGPNAKLNGRLTSINSWSQPSVHRLDARRSVIIENAAVRSVYERVTGGITPLPGNVTARSVRGVLVLLLNDRIVCDIDPVRPALRELDTPEQWPAVLAFDGSRLILSNERAVRVLRAGQPVRVLPLPRGFEVTSGDDVVRGNRVIIVREGALIGAEETGDDMETVARPVPWTLEVSLLDVETGAVTPPAKTPGGWTSIVMGCCSGWLPRNDVAWVDAATAEKLLHADLSQREASALMHGAVAAVVDEWNELITWHAPQPPEPEEPPRL